MHTFFQHSLTDKMEEDTQNSEEVDDQDKPEAEHSHETQEPDNTETDEENIDADSSDDTQITDESETAPEEAVQADPEFDSQSEEPPKSDKEEQANETDEVDETSEYTKEIGEVPETTDENSCVVDQTTDAEQTAATQDTTEEITISEVAPIPDIEVATVIEDTTETDETTEEIEEITEPIEQEIQFSLGESVELYDFVATFEESECTGSEHISVNMADSSGGITKPAILEHPPSDDVSRIIYELDLPSTEENENLHLYFNIGLRDGVVFDDPERQPGGVKFSIEIAGEKCFESVSTECQWTPYNVDITRFAGQKVQIVLMTECNVEGNGNYAWGLWGHPKLIKLTKPDGQQEHPSVIQCGIAFATLPEERTALCEFSTDKLTPVHEIVAMLQKELEVEPIEITLYVAQPKLEIVSVGTTAAVVSTGEAFEVQCTIRNIGAGPLLADNKTRLSISDIKLRRGRSSQNMKTLAPDETTTLVWYARGVSRPTTLNFNVSLKSRHVQGKGKKEGTIEIRPAVPKLEAQVETELHTYMHKEHAVIENKHLRVVLVHSGDIFQSINRKPKKNLPERQETGYEFYAIYVAKGSTYQQVATSKMIAMATYISDGTKHNLQFIPDNIQLSGNSLGEASIRLSGEHKDIDGVTWKLQLQFVLAEEAKRIKATYNLQVDAERELLAFHGTEIYAGHKSTREKKTAALFPGLEFLQEDEPSSNTRDAAPPINNRLVPHPYKITIPVMAVEMQKSVVGIAWDHKKSWDGNEQNLSAIFASPNWHDHQRNHLMGLFLPTVPNWVNENEHVAENAYQMTPERPISLECEIIADGNASILESISHWTAAYGIPEPLEPPRDDVEEIELSRHGFMHSVWDAEKRQSRHCVDWDSRNEPSFATLLWYDYLVTQSEDVKHRVTEIAEKTIADSNTKGLAGRGSCHILGGEFPFYYGHLDVALTHYEDEVQPLLESQAKDGSWSFHPTSERTKSLGNIGDAVLGTCAANALKLLKHARITRHKTSLDAGRKALSFMDRFSVPRGAQAWECPLYQPDLLAAAHAVGAYVEAHQITGNKSYLRRAEYWANAGLPFLYHWHLPDRPGMLYASIPVFGTTFYTHPWFGVPVQWNGLVYAYYLQRLNQYAKDDKWQKIAAGITTSAMYQQWTDGELKGTYPDGFYGFCTEGKGPHLNPEDIMVNVYSLRGLDPGVKTVIAGSIHLSSGAIPDAVSTSRNGTVNWSLNYAENETSHTLIVGYEKPPSAITARGTKGDETNTPEFEIPQVNALEEVTSGWRYIPEKDAILIKQIHTTTDMQFQLKK
ncbi:hypothetical protein F4225_04735 [Candidatus Poribacteria bacterium]|nr:hypothetical protein [Candidatus Poribacteria bacterium]